MSLPNKQTLITLFNRKFNEFLDDLIRTFPEDRDFRKFKTSVNLFLTMDERKLQTVFNLAIQKYKEPIQNKDDSVFLNTPFEAIEKEGGEAITADLIDKLKGYWTQLDESNRNAIWGHLTLLTTLSDRCANAK